CKHILKRYDIAGSIVLHTVVDGHGDAEHLLSVQPSYSCAKIIGDELRIRAKLKEDFNGDREAWYKKVTDTVNMISMLTDMVSMQAMALMEMDKKLKSVIDVEENDDGYTSHTTQNN